MGKVFNFLQLSENIATAGQPTEEQLAHIADEGYEVVLNIALTGTEYALEDEAGLVKDLGMEYFHIPVIWEDPTPEDFENFIEFMQQNQSKKVFVHCAANMRVSVFMALYRVLHLGWDREEAFAVVHEIWEPNEIWKAYIDSIFTHHGQWKNINHQHEGD